MLFRIRKTITVLLSAFLAACGGGGGGGGGGNQSTSPNSTQTISTGFSGNSTPTGASENAGTTLTINADDSQTTAGGSPVKLISSDGQTVQWSLSFGDPGSLDRSSGNTVFYLPPATLGSDLLVTVVAESGNTSATYKILVKSNAGAPTGTVGAISTTPSLPDTSTPASETNTGGTTAPRPAPGVYLVAGNDFGAGLADGSGLSSRFNRPWRLARDGQGNIYVADLANSAIRKITPDGIVSTLAGMPGIRGYADGPAATARFGYVTGIALDNGGNLYVTEYGAIRKITPDGMVSTVALNQSTGENSLYPSGGIAVDSTGTLYVTESNAVKKITPDGTISRIAGGSFGQLDGPAATAGFLGLNDIALDAAGNIYVTDSGRQMLSRASANDPKVVLASYAVRKITPSGTVSTVAGTAWRYTTTTGAWESLATGETWDGTSRSGIYRDGPGAQARFGVLSGINIDRAGNLFVADLDNSVIRRITPDGVVSTVAGIAGQSGSNDGDIATARLTTPRGLAVAPNGELTVAESENHTIRRVVPGSHVLTLAGAAPKPGSTDGVRGNALFKTPTGITADSSGNLYAADSGNATIRKIGPDGAVTTVAGFPGDREVVDGPVAQARFSYPNGVVIDPSGNIFVTDVAAQTVRRISTSGIVSTIAGVTGQSSEADFPPFDKFLGGPEGIVMDGDGNLFVSTSLGRTIRQISPQGTLSLIAGNPQNDDYTKYYADGTGKAALFGRPEQIARDRAGNLYVVDSRTTVRKITPAGVVTTLAGKYIKGEHVDGTAENARFIEINGIAVDADGNVYVGDVANIRKITPDGVVTTIAGVGATGAAATRKIYRPMSLHLIGDKSLVYTSGNGVFRLELP